MSVIKTFQFLSKEKIEDLANDLLMRMQGTPNFPNWPGVAERAVDFLKLGMVWDKIPNQNGRPVAARIYPTQRLIEINEDIPKLQQDPGFVESTIAHEVGHWVLHINEEEADGIVEQLELPLDCVTTEQPFLCRDVGERMALSSPKTQADWVEWQAQYFASCLLMPRYKLEEARKKYDLTKWSHLYALRKDLGVTISNFTNRLQDLGWIDIPKGSKQIYLRNTGFNR
ncbi:ImmA/IrrE family metallo-endopeptidase [Microcoleus sp. FACHB-68]|uniref:ImmA/IrrE family metallo-endopeptidase n=1 Tax=Microcoleus sp. FACHB-68 TaxID=2692826 RepID=UPI001683EBDB|nr:ImmA/IrrE family metallo-endopeptidase [Microcoleus sp. FACHB-68]MBD1939475.1 ImmA/IrrE family metallo-endopeptidase [Microcoleus sp. FACHB-68]